jgi:hypothetical protein
MSNNPFLAIDKRILADSGTSGEAAKNLFTLCDRIGSRFAGTEGYRQAAEFMLSRFRKYHLQDAHLEPFEFTAWRRGAPATLVLQAPVLRAVDCYTLPYSAATEPGGVTAEIVDIGAGTRDDLAVNLNRIHSRIVLTSGTGLHRGAIYAQCERAGAAGFILSNPEEGMQLHTGSVGDVRGGAIPAVSIGCESGRQIQRFAMAGPTRITLATQATMMQATTWNVMGELKGNEYPDELVIIGGHLDSHEIGPGAYDNATGAVMVMEAARLLAKQRRHLKRTIRFIGFAGEEVGLLGSHYHARTHAAQLRKARFMLNCDMPALGRPRGLAFHKCPKAAAYMATLATQMESELLCQNREHCHSDHYPFILQGLPTAGLAGGKIAPSVRHFVHMAADTVEKISLTDLRDCAAFVARILLRAANDDQWPHMRRTSGEIKEWKAASDPEKAPRSP